MHLNQVDLEIERDIGRTIDKIKQLVRVPSISAQNSGVECADLLVKLLKEEIGFKSEKIATSGYPVVFAEKQVGAAKTLVFYNHYDVQPVDPLDHWNSPPFEPEVKEGKLYGRGVEDNKGNIIARIHAIRAYESIFKQLPLNIKFIIEGQEEMGSPYLHEFVENHPDRVQGDFCIWESGERNASRQQQVWLGVKGILYLTLEAYGAKRQIHSGWGGVVENPAWELIWALGSLKNEEGRILIEDFYEGVQTPTKEELDNLTDIPFDEEAYIKDFGIKKFMKTDLELKKEYYYAPSLTIDGLGSGYQGSGAKTIIPDTAMAKIDFRLVPRQNPQEILNKLRNHLDRYNFKRVTITDSHGYPPARTPITSQYLQIVRETAEKIYGSPLIVHPTSAGSGPMYLFANKMDCVSFGCGHFGSNAHSPNENILIEDIILNMKHLAAIFHAFQGES